MCDYINYACEVIESERSRIVFSRCNFAAAGGGHQSFRLDQNEEKKKRSIRSSPKQTRSLLASLRHHASPPPNEFQNRLNLLPRRNRNRIPSKVSPPVLLPLHDYYYDRRKGRRIKDYNETIRCFHRHKSARRSAGFQRFLVPTR